MPDPTACELLVTSQYLLTQDSERRIFSPGAVAVAGGLVAAVGPAPELEKTFAPARTLDLGQSVAMPGLINAHTHAPMTLFRGLADDTPLMVWLEKHVWPLEARLTDELVHLGALMACAEMISMGATCFLDGYLKEALVGKAVDASGMRAVLGEGFFGFPSPMFPTPDHAWRTIRDLEARFRDHPRISTAVTPHAVFTCSPDDLTDSFALAEELDLPWQVHCAETPAETALVLGKHGKRPTALLADLGLLGPRTILHHAVDVTEAEIELLAATGTKATHNPRSNMKLASGVSPVPALLAAGVTVGLGTDGAASNNSLNMIREMDTAALLAKVSLADPTALPAQTVLDMATLGSAACLGLDGPGALEPGRPADLIALDLNRPHLLPVHNPLSQVVYAATGAEVCLTMVAGDIIYNNGRFAHLDMEAVTAEAQNIAAWAAGR